MEEEAVLESVVVLAVVVMVLVVMVPVGDTCVMGDTWATGDDRHKPKFWKIKRKDGNEFCLPWKKKISDKIMKNVRNDDIMGNMNSNTEGTEEYEK